MSVQDACDLAYVLCLERLAPEQYDEFDRRLTAPAESVPVRQRVLLSAFGLNPN